MNCVKAFEGIYHTSPVSVSFCPYRICPIGAHSDHQYGKITGLAIDRGIHLAYGPKQNGVVELISLNFSKRAQFHVRQVPERRQMDWADYLRGAAAALSKRYPLATGIGGVIEGGLPIGGLSSSAAVIIAFLTALCHVNNLCLSGAELVDIAVHAEVDYVGISVGKMDPSCEVYSKKNHLLYLDTRDDGFERIPAHPDMAPYEIAVFFSGNQRTLVGSKFNMRVDETKSAAYALKAFAVEDGLSDHLRAPHESFAQSRLRDVPREIYYRYKSRLPGAWRRRAEHFYTEFERVEKGAEAWRRGDLKAFGKLSFESGRSSIDCFETGSDELKTLYEVMLRVDGIYGGRFSGAGFNGCCVALIDPAFRERIAREVEDAYLRVFPNLKSKFSSHFCHSADGVRADRNEAFK